MRFIKVQDTLKAQNLNIALVFYDEFNIGYSGI